MKCPNCLNDLNAKFAYCPFCRKRLPNSSFSTIKPAATFNFEDQAQPKIWRGALQLLLLISSVIALAVIINFISTDQPKPATPPIPATAETTEVVSEVVVAQEVLLPPVVAPIQLALKVKATSKPQLISILSDSIVATAQANQSHSAPIAKSQSMIATTKPEAVNYAPDLLPRRKTQLVDSRPVTREIPPAPELTKVNSSNSELRLEVDSSAIVLQKNIGLVSINSYVPARIYIDGQFSGMTPRAIKLVAGAHQISLMAEGYREYSRQVKVDGHQQIGMMASMTKKNTTQVAGIVEQ